MEPRQTSRPFVSVLQCTFFKQCLQVVLKKISLDCAVCASWWKLEMWWHYGGLLSLIINTAQLIDSLH